MREIADERIPQESAARILVQESLSSSRKVIHASNISYSYDETPVIRKLSLKIIKGYKFFISPLFGHSCRYLPTCSEYSIEALKEFGLAKGTFLSLKRILSCHPIKFLGGGDGFDPVKKNIKVKK